MRILSQEVEDDIKIYAHDVETVTDIVKEQKAFGFVLGVLSATVMCNAVFIICAVVFGK